MVLIILFLCSAWINDSFIVQNSVNAQEAKIPFPWLVFNEKIKVNSVFLRDSTGVSDSVVLLFGGNVSSGGLVILCFPFAPCIMPLSPCLPSF